MEVIQVVIPTILAFLLWKALIGPDPSENPFKLKLKLLYLLCLFNLTAILMVKFGAGWGIIIFLCALAIPSGRDHEAP